MRLGERLKLQVKKKDTNLIQENLLTNHNTALDNILQTKKNINLR